MDFGREVVAVPQGRGPGVRVEPLDVHEAQDGEVVVADDRVKVLQRAQAADDLVWFGAVADDVAAADVAFDAEVLEKIEDGGQGFQIRVDVGKDPVDHRQQR